MEVTRTIPVELMQLGPRSLGIKWSDGHTSDYQVRNIRLNCRCANCIDEWTREKKLNPDAIPNDIKPLVIETVGRYALKMSWSDGHDTGIYTFDQLRAECECKQCNP